MQFKESSGYVVVEVTNSGKLRVRTNAWGDPQVFADSVPLVRNDTLADSVDEFGGSNRRVLALPVKFLDLVDVED